MASISNKVIVEQEPAELILLKGNPLFTLVPGVKLMVVANTSSDVLFHPRSGKYYLLISGRWFEAHHYGVDRESGLIDYAQVARMARDIRPALLIAGGSAYPRHIDFERMRHIADSVDALLLVDMAHFAGLVAAGAHPSPLPHADIVTCTTTKTLRGPRGGLILARANEAVEKKLNSMIFPGIQGGPLMHVIAAKAVALKEAMEPSFRFLLLSQPTAYIGRLFRRDPS